MRPDAAAGPGLAGERTRLPVGVMLATLVLGLLGWAMFFAVFRGVPGQDFVVFHTAARMLLGGHMDAMLDPQGFTEVMNATHRAWFAQQITVLHPWVYPPVTFLLAVPFGFFSYPWALSLFLLVTFAALAWALWAWGETASGRWLLIAGAALCPATAFNIGAGQLGFFVAAIVLGAMRLLPQRPFLAGAVFSLLCLKPQFVLFIPVALLAGRHIRAIAGGLAGGSALILASIALAGTGAWRGWLAIITGANPIFATLVHAVRVYDQSIDTCLHTLGASATLAEAGEALAMAGCAVCVWAAFRIHLALRYQLCVLLCAMTLGAPHVGDYDEILPAIAALLLLQDGRAAGLACAVWLATAFNPPALIAVLGAPVLTYMSALTPLFTAALMIGALRGRALP